MLQLLHTTKSISNGHSNYHSLTSSTPSSYLSHRSIPFYTSFYELYLFWLSRISPCLSENQMRAISHTSTSKSFNQTFVTFFRFSIYWIGMYFPSILYLSVYLRFLGRRRSASILPDLRYLHSYCSLSSLQLQSISVNLNRYLKKLL